jgi:predicted aldo/keto reductase-like oxidoreductase
MPIITKETEPVLETSPSVKQMENSSVQNSCTAWKHCSPQRPRQLNLIRFNGKVLQEQVENVDKIY